MFKETYTCGDVTATISYNGETWTSYVKVWDVKDIDPYFDRYKKIRGEYYGPREIQPDDIVSKGTEFYLKLQNIRYQFERDIKNRGFVITLFNLDRAYGGPEEGGWYYTCGSVDDIFYRSTIDEAMTLAQELEAKTADEYVDSGLKVYAEIGFQPKQDWPEQRPTYS